jgi:hypothetical protein
MKRAATLAAIAVFATTLAFGAAGPPLAGVWNIATTGKAASSGDLSFRITANDGSDPVDITVPVISGASEDSVARSIRRALSSQLPRQRYTVELGQGTNVLVSDPRGQPNFSLELVDSDVENVRVAVQIVTPSAPPTVPTQSIPAEPSPATPPASSVPGNATSPVPPTGTPASNPNTPVPDPNTTVPNPNAPLPNPTPVPGTKPAPAPGNSAPPPP